MDLMEIFAYFEEEQYEDLIKELNRELTKNSMNPALYYYRFLAYNRDYNNMDFNDLKDEVDLNKAFDLEEEYSYLAEYKLIKEIDGAEKEAIINALRMNEAKVDGLTKKKIEANSLSSKRKIICLKKLIMSLENPKQLSLLRKVLESFVFREDAIESSKDILPEVLVYCKENVESLMDYLDSKLGTSDCIEFVIENGILKKASPNVVKKIVLPNTIRVIEKEVFRGFKALESIEIPEGVKEIYMDAFKDCTSLKEITLPNSIEKFGWPLFSGCFSLESITMPAFLIYNDEYRYSLGQYFGEIEYSGTIKVGQTFDPKAEEPMKYYYIPRALKKVIITEGIQREARIDAYTFENCSNLEEIVLPKNLTGIYHDAFSGCSSLKNIEIPEAVKEIYKDAFKDCTSLKEITLPNSIEKFEFPLFSGCFSLESITMPAFLIYDDEYRYILGQYFGKTEYSGTIKIGQTWTSDGENTMKYYYIPRALKKVIITEGIQREARIEAYTFENCSYLEEIVLPKNLTRIHRDAFSGCSSLKNIEIPEGVKEIGLNAFSGCRSLERVILPAGVTDISSNAFSGSTKIYCKMKKPMFGYPKGFDKNWCSKSNNVFWNYKEE